MNFDYGVLSIDLQYLFLIRLCSVLIIKVFFSFNMHTDMFPFLSQGERHIQANSR